VNNKTKPTSAPMSEMGQSRHFDRAPRTSGLPRTTDIGGTGRHVSKVPTSDISSK
jgi:hypothetical protein